MLENKRWLPGVGSNHYTANMYRIYNLQILKRSRMPCWTRKTGTRTQLVHGFAMSIEHFLICPKAPGRTAHSDYKPGENGRLSRHGTTRARQLRTISRRPQEPHSRRTGPRIPFGKPRTGPAVLADRPRYPLPQDRESWGAKVIDRLATDLKRAFPNMKAFSPRNLTKLTG